MNEDIEDVAETTKPRHPPSRRRTRPVAEPVAGAANGPSPTDVAALVAQNQALAERVEALEAGTMRTVPMAPEPQADARVGAPIYRSPFLDRLLEQTKPVPEDFAGDQEPPYNVPERTYLKPDGEFVSLQGDARSRAFYQAKGYKLLDKAETEHYEKVERPQILQATRRKAHLITTIRNMFKREPSLVGWREDPEYDNTLHLMSISQLEDEWEDLRARSINPGQRMPSMPRFKSDDAKPDPNMAGVESTPTRSAADIKPTVRQGRDVEVTSKNFNAFR